MRGPSAGEGRWVTIDERHSPSLLILAGRLCAYGNEAEVAVLRGSTIAGGASGLDDDKDVLDTVLVVAFSERISPDEFSYTWIIDKPKWRNGRRGGLKNRWA